MKEEIITFKNEMGKEVKIVFRELRTNGLKGSRNVPVNYTGVEMKMSSVDHTLTSILSKKELDKLRFGANKFLKEVGRKSELSE